MKIIKTDQILAAKKQPPSSPFVKGELHTPQSPLDRGEDNADTSALEKQIDEMVWAGTQALPLQRHCLPCLPAGRLTPEEIAIVEGKG